jgi:hypothetical protein
MGVGASNKGENCPPSRMLFVAIMARMGIWNDCTAFTTEGKIPRGGSARKLYMSDHVVAAKVFMDWYRMGIVNLLQVYRYTSVNCT